MAHWRTLWRARTMSFEFLSGITSRFAKLILCFSFYSRQRAIEEFHACFHAKGGPHAGQGHSELYERNGDRRLHADYDSLGTQDARHGGDIGQHPPNERIHNLQ